MTPTLYLLIWAAGITSFMLGYLIGRCDRLRWKFRVKAKPARGYMGDTGRSPLGPHD